MHLYSLICAKNCVILQLGIMMLMHRMVIWTFKTLQLQTLSLFFLWHPSMRRQRISQRALTWRENRLLRTWLKKRRHKLLDILKVFGFSRNRRALANSLPQEYHSHICPLMPASKTLLSTIIWQSLFVSMCACSQVFMSHVILTYCLIYLI